MALLFIENGSALCYKENKMVDKKDDEEVEEEKYEPLPDSVFIRKSSIHGYGLFARTPIKSGQHLGMSHIFAPGFSKDSYIRTPLGGFINHSDTPNCKKEESPEESAITYYTLVTIADIPADTELTLSYTLYEIDDYRNVTVIGAI